MMMNKNNKKSMNQQKNKNKKKREGEQEEKEKEKAKRKEELTTTGCKGNLSTNLLASLTLALSVTRRKQQTHSKSTRKINENGLREQLSLLCFSSLFSLSLSLLLFFYFGFWSFS